MRKELKKIGKQEGHTFIGEFVRNGFKEGYTGFPIKTVLLKDIRLADSKEIITDHLWFNETKGFAKLELSEGDTIQFDARVNDYQKGYKGHREDVHRPVETDYKLSYPSKIKVLER